MPRASDVSMDLTHGERIEVKWVDDFQSPLIDSDGRLSDARPPTNQPKKIVIPGFISMFRFPSNADEMDVNVHKLTSQSSPFGWPVRSVSFSTTASHISMLPVQSSSQNTYSVVSTFPSPSSSPPGI